MVKKLTYKYFAIRVSNTVIIRRTSDGVQKIKSVLHKPGSEFSLVQISYIGGKPIGSISYNELYNRTGYKILNLGYVRIPVEKVKALRPFLLKGDK